MTCEFLVRLSAPFLHLLPVAREGLTEALQPLEELRRTEDLMVRRLRGAKMRTEAALFDEVSAALQFPDFSGEGWAAFEACLNELEWLEGGAAAIVVSDADQLLAEADGEAFGTLLEALQAERDAPVHFLLQAEGGQAECLLGRIRAQGAEAERLPCA